MTVLIMTTNGILHTPISYCDLFSCVWNYWRKRPNSKMHPHKMRGSK